MKCTCGCETFSAKQVHYVDVIVDEDGIFMKYPNDIADNSCGDYDQPYGPFICTECGTEYEELDE